jgi:hypothetical protein
MPRVRIQDLARVAPDLKGIVVVTTSDAATLEEDARIRQTVELPSQMNDFDRDGTTDELEFAIDLKPQRSES